MRGPHCVCLAKTLTCRPASSSFDSVMRSRYFPGGPTPDGLESDIIFKSLAGEELRERARRESEGEMMTDNRWKYFGLENIWKYSEQVQNDPA